MGNTKTLKKKILFPNVYVLLFIIAIVAAILTYTVPAGQFERIVVNDVTQVVPGSFALIEHNPQSPWQI